MTSLTLLRHQSVIGHFHFVFLKMTAKMTQNFKKNVGIAGIIHSKRLPVERIKSLAIMSGRKFLTPF